MSIIHWKKEDSSIRPFSSHRHLSSLQEQMNSLFDTFFDFGRERPSMLEGNSFPISLPAVDVAETSKEYALTVELPGLESKDIELKVGEGYITLQGEKKSETEEKDTHYIRRESSQGSFKRTIYLPELANSQGVKAQFKNGVLKISVPKREESLQKEKTVTIEAA